MTSSEYRNTVYWTLHAHTPADETDLLVTARRIFNNLGVPFPQGTLADAIRILSSGDYMGWSICNADLAQQCANNGYPAIAVNENALSLILPEEHTVAVNSPVAVVDHPIIWKSSVSSSTQYFVFARLLDNNDVTLKNSDVVSQQNSGIMVAAATTTTCSSSCQVACQSCNACQTSCELNCQTGCQVSCQTTCQASCQTGCQVSCQSCNTCQAICETSCQSCDTCQSNCELSCQTGCQVSCQSCNTCQTTCESACQGSCQTSCQSNETPIDTREKVTVEYVNNVDGDYCIITFSRSGAIWKTVGCDLMLPENLSNNDMTLEYEECNPQEQRYTDNVIHYQNEHEYTYKELALIYLFDPLGVEFFVKTFLSYELSVGTYIIPSLEFKDNLFKQIFSAKGHREDQFYFKLDSNNNKYYVSKDSDDRDEMYSHAEALFGYHTDINDVVLFSNLLSLIFNNIPVISDILMGVEMYQALFFKGSVDGILSNSASSALNQYVDNYVDSSHTVFHTLFNWTSSLFDVFTSLNDIFSGTIAIPVAGDIGIYETIRDQTDYKVYMKKSDRELSMADIIDRFNTNNN